jgi:hypothetical protein
LIALISSIHKGPGYTLFFWLNLSYFNEKKEGREEERTKQMQVNNFFVFKTSNSEMTYFSKLKKMISEY